MPTLLPILLAILAAALAYLLRLGVLSLPVELATLSFGLGVVGAAFAMLWAAEAAERDVPRALALTAVALLAVFPEYAVDIIFAFKAGQDPAFAPYAAANMTGSNRLLLGLGWPTVAALAWFQSGRRLLRLDRADLLPRSFLSVATLYSFTLPLRAAIAPIDSLVLIALFAMYAVLAARARHEEPDLVGPAAAIGDLPTLQRRLVILLLFAFAGVTIGISAEPFADGLVRTGQKLGVDEFLLVQWLAPLASETPEFLVAALLALRSKPTVALGLLLSAKLNQWTLLVGSLALSYSLGAARFSALPLDERQVGEVLLTAAQSLAGVALLAWLSFGLGRAALLASLFVAQLALGGVLRAGLHNTDAESAELFGFSGLYVLLAVWQLAQALPMLRGEFRNRTAVQARAEEPQVRKQDA